nr:uncharacterized protein LOC127326321 isoform X3 [Lolium perenne]
MTSGSALKWDHLFATVGIRSRVAQKMKCSENLTYREPLLPIPCLLSSPPIAASSLPSQSAAASSRFSSPIRCRGVERDGGDPCGASGGGLAVPRERGDRDGGDPCGPSGGGLAVPRERGDRDGGDPCGASGGGLAVPRERGDEIGGALDLRERRRAAWRRLLSSRLRGSRFSSPLTYLGLSRLATARWKVAAGQGSGRRRAPAPPVVSFISTRRLATQRWATRTSRMPLLLGMFSSLSGSTSAREEKKSTRLEMLSVTVTQPARHGRACKIEEFDWSASHSGLKIHHLNNGGMAYSLQLTTVGKYFTSCPKAECTSTQRVGSVSRPLTERFGVAELG